MYTSAPPDICWLKCYIKNRPTYVNSDGALGAESKISGLDHRSLSGKIEMSGAVGATVRAVAKTRKIPSRSALVLVR